MLKHIPFICILLIYSTGTFCQEYEFKEYDIWPGKSGSNTNFMIQYKKSVYFIATDSVHGIDIWYKNEGMQPTLLFDFKVNIPYTNMATLGGNLYFAASDSANGEELWVYNGINNPTIASDIYSGASSSQPRNLTPLGDKLYFTAFDSSTKYRELFVYNHRTKHTIKCTNLSRNNTYTSHISNLLAYNDKLVMTVSNNDIGRELFIYDPTVNIEYMLADIAPGPLLSYPSDLLVYKNKLFFTATNQPGVISTTYQLYVYDGIKSPERVEQLDRQGIYKYPGMYNIALYNDYLYILTKTSSNSPYWVYKINPDNYSGEYVTEINQEFGANIQNFLTHNNRFFFFGINTTGKPGTIWMYKENSMPINIADTSFPIYLIQRFTPIGHSIYFNAQTNTKGYELYELKLKTNSIQDEQQQHNYAIYPNPANEFTTLKLSLKQSQSLNVTLTDMSGRTIYQTGNVLYSAAEHNINIPLSNLPAGSYMYSVQNSEGVMMSSGKLQKL